MKHAGSFKPQVGNRITLGNGGRYGLFSAAICRVFSGSAQHVRGYVAIIVHGSVLQHPKQ